MHEHEHETHDKATALVKCCCPSASPEQACQLADKVCAELCFAETLLKQQNLATGSKS